MTRSKDFETETFNGEKYVKSESRNCFGIVWFDSEEAADRAGSKDCGSYNGGYFHGMPGGRTKRYDCMIDGVMCYAVTTG